jgi:hypothetical protein
MERLALQLTHRLNTIEDFEALFPLTESEKQALSAPGCSAWR